MNLCEILVINFKYYRKKYNLSHEKFAEVLGTTLSYLNQIENNKVDVKYSIIDKFAINTNYDDKNSRIEPKNLVTYIKEHIIIFSRIDKIKKN